MSAAPVEQLQVGDLVHLDGKPQIWRVDSFHGTLARLVPVTRTGRIVHPDRLTPAREPR